MPKGIYTRITKPHCADCKHWLNGNMYICDKCFCDSSDRPPSSYIKEEPKVRRILRDVKFLIPPAKFMIDFSHKELYEVEEMLAADGQANWVCWSMNVKDWEPFKKILNGEYYGWVDLDLRLGGWDGQQLVFMRPDPDDSTDYVDAKDVIEHKPISTEKEVIKMDEKAIAKPLSPEERIKELEREKAELQLMIKKQADYEKIKEGTDSVALMVRAFQDSGMSREEAIQIVIATIPSAMMANSMPSFLRKK